MTQKIDRRMAIKFAAATSFVTAVRGIPAFAQTMAEAPDQSDTILTEVQFGDPNNEPESLTFNPILVQKAIGGTTKASFVPRIEDIRNLFVIEATKHLGNSRATTKNKIVSHLDLFDLPFDINGKHVPFCAAGLSYVAATIYAQKIGLPNISTSTLRDFLGDIDHHHFYPSPSVMDMRYVAMGKRRWVSRETAIGKFTPRSGWLVVYDWNGDGVADHVGLVESVQSDQLHTIEFNTSSTNATNGGAVARRTRTLNRKVQGFIRPELVRAV